MASHYVGFARGVEGTGQSDFVTGTSSTGTLLFEFRLLDGVTPSRLEVRKAIEAIELFFSDHENDLASVAGFDVGG
jgi:hypothetical protein